MSYIRTGFGRFRYMYRLLMAQSNLQRVAGSATSKEEQKKRAAGATLRHISNFLYPGMAYPVKCDDPKAGGSPKNRKLGRRHWVIIVLIVRY